MATGMRGLTFLLNTVILDSLSCHVLGDAAAAAALPGGLQESLASVLDCSVNGKTGLCVPTVLKDVVCVPLGFQFAPDPKVCGADNVCCHSTVEGKPATTSKAVTTTTTTAMPSEAQKGSASILLLTAAKPDQASLSITLPQPTDSPAAASPAQTDDSDPVTSQPVRLSKPSKTKSTKPKPFKIPASLTAFIPNLDPQTDDNTDDDDTTAKPGSPGGIPVKFCRVGSAQGMCVKSNLIQSLCLPLGFATSPQGCSGGYMCCFTPNADDNVVSTKPAQQNSAPTKTVVNPARVPVNQPSDSAGVQSSPPKSNTQKETIKASKPPLDTPSGMDTCNPQPNLAGLCIRSDIAPMVCTPLGYTIGGRLTCSNDRVCCHLDKPGMAPLGQGLSSPDQGNPSSPFLQRGSSARYCQLGPNINGVCVPANLISSCPLFGKKVSAFGCATRLGAPPNYCCYEDLRPASSTGDRNALDPPPADPEPMQPFISVAGSETVPKLDSMVCGRKGLSGIEPRALARRAKLLGSHPTLPGEICWHAALFDQEGKPFCNGALVHREWVLTTAHCVKRVTPAKTTVKLGLWAFNSSLGRSVGSDDLIPPTQSFRVLEAFIHYSYDAVTLDNNVALLHLDSQADFSEPQVCLVCLPSQESYEGQQCSVTSFSSPDGQTIGKDSVVSQLDMNVINSSDCQSSLVATGKLQNNFRLNGDVTVCAKPDTNADTCRGDGGSSFACQNPDGNYELAGLVSWGLSCGLGAPTVFTRVWLYNSWIQEIIRRYS